MTRSVIDNAILLSAMSGEDPADPATRDNPKGKTYFDDLSSGQLTGLRFGALKNFLLRDSVYRVTVDRLRDLGATVIEVDPLEVEFDGFGTVLDADMKADLPAYLRSYAADAVSVTSAADIVAYNLRDTLLRIPYGQARFEGIVADETSPAELVALKTRLKAEGIRFFETPMQAHQLDAILSINNYNAGYAAAAHYPCLTVPMGYTETGEPRGLTFIGRPFTEDQLLKMAYAFERATQARVMPAGYR
jgi:amidase